MHQPPEVVQGVASHAKLLSRLVHLGSSEEVRVRAEAMRALVNVVRYGGPESVPRVAQAGGISAFATLLAEEHVLLRNEAAVGLVKCGGDAEQRCAMANAGVPLALVKQFDDPANPPELLCSLLALATVLAADKGIAETAEGQRLVDKVEVLARDGNGKVQAQACAAITILKGN